DIAETSQPVLSPAVGPRAGMVMGKVTPGVAVVAVVFSDRTPLALAQIRTPQIPVAGLTQAVFEPSKPLDPIAFGARHASAPVGAQHRPYLIAHPHRDEEHPPPVDSLLTGGAGPRSPRCVRSDVIRPSVLGLPRGRTPCWSNRSGTVVAHPYEPRPVATL